MTTAPGGQEVEVRIRVSPVWQRVAKALAPGSAGVRISNVRSPEVPDLVPVRRTGAFSCRTTLPAGVDADRVQARLEDGVLTVQVPRPESAKPRRIKIA